MTDLEKAICAFLSNSFDILARGFMSEDHSRYHESVDKFKRRIEYKLKERLDVHEQLVMDEIPEDEDKV